MRRTTILIMALLATFTLLIGVNGAMADNIKDRMKARLPVINALKSQGLIGENNKGFLEFRSGQKPEADVIKAENTDRMEVYRAIAERQKTTPEFVGQTRAAQIAEKEPAGTWVQSPDGAWKRK